MLQAICDSFSDTPQVKEIKQSIDENSVGAEDPVLVSNILGCDGNEVGI